MHHSSGANRIEFLDGLRGLAVLLVILFHSYARWPELVPYGSTFSDIMLFSYGWLGVQLFFLISGFVIFMTLDRCTNLSEFFARRWLRLFPAMLICSLFIWYTAPLFPERPAGLPTIDQLIPGLTFVDPQWLQRFGIHAKPIEGAFWSLFIEAQFYVVAGASYFIVIAHPGCCSQYAVSTLPPARQVRIAATAVRPRKTPVAVTEQTAA